MSPSFIDDVILKPTGLWGMLTCGLGTAYTLLEPLSHKQIPDDYLLHPALFAAGFVVSYLMYSNHKPSQEGQS
ncbi:MAG: hypothetical protein KAT77_00870 [Nanoarchaeota archaeon]|nr:hypothetical protein [Nanoarchaeota archaeon]